LQRQTHTLTKADTIKYIDIDRQTKIDINSHRETQIDTDRHRQIQMWTQTQCNRHIRRRRHIKTDTV
jgi:hypothetical protein